jgi:hypothetical protein
MRSLLTALLLALLVTISNVNASGTPLHEKIARPKVTFSAQNTSAHLDDIHHLKCQLNISRQHDTFSTLRRKAHHMSDTFGKDLYLLNKNTLKACTQVHKDMTDLGKRGFRAQLNDWAPIIFNSPIERFVYDGQVFLDGLIPLKQKALDLAKLYQHNISACITTLEKSCAGTSEPCMGNEAFTSRARSALELKACENTEALANVNLAAEAWRDMAYDIAKIRRVFKTTWALVEDAQMGEQKATEEWVAGVVARWIVMLEDLVVRTRKKGDGGKTSAGTSASGRVSLPLPLFYQPLRGGPW